MTKTDPPFLPTTPAEAPEVRGSELRSTVWLAGDVLTMTETAILHYEIARAWWPQFVSIPWMQALASKYFAWKTRRICARFRALDAMKKRVDARRASSANSDSAKPSR